MTHLDQGEAERLQIDPFDSEEAQAVFERRAWLAVIGGGIALLGAGFGAGWAFAQLLGSAN